MTAVPSRIKENIAYMSMPVPGDTFVTHEAHCRNPHVRTNCYMLQAIGALAGSRRLFAGSICRSPCVCDLAHSKRAITSFIMVTTSLRSLLLMRLCVADAR